ncbi:glycosyl hydrolase family 92-domain-containing protein [Collybia nuda]|uniref:Glycosyl hydrolase family 92-domain-containing protein n=1 Tax=Collybia nuda TaxID=64659 RepID=A0A9P5YAY3_9AGAR|nr:glycosyl hydrolase family 92-domain-containing protein [Collybia nuda]
MRIIICTILAVTYFVGSIAFGSTIPPAFAVPPSDEVDSVNVLVGNGGIAPSVTGGMIPSTAPPFAMTRWVAQTRRNYVSRTPYNWTADRISGFQGTRQPAIWMGESGSVGVVPGFAANGDGKNVKADFDARGMKKVDGTEILTPSYYSIELEDDVGGGGTVLVEQTATSRVGHLRFTFRPSLATFIPSLLVEMARPSITSSTPTNITFPIGDVTLSPTSNSSTPFEICGSNNERQDRIITPISIADKANKFKGYACAHFSSASTIISHGVIQNTTITPLAQSGSGPMLSAYVLFKSGGQREIVVDVRVGTSFISTDLARSHIFQETPAKATIENTARTVREAWIEKLGRIKVQGGTKVQRESFYTGIFHTLHYPSEQHESGMYFSGNDGEVHSAKESYTGYSIWDTFRAAWAWQIILAPERIPGMVTSMLADFKEAGRLPMWKNIVETNIMVGTHSDSLVAEAAVKGITGFDPELAWEAVSKNAFTPPFEDATVVYSDRQENVDFEARAGLSTDYGVEGKGWVANDIHSESASRTLDYAYDDFSAAMLARAIGKPEEVVQPLLQRSMQAPFTLWNNETGFIQARNADGSWAGDTAGFTEGDKWAYSFDIVQALPELIERRGGNASFVQSLDDHFNGGHNDHRNEPSHHIPYLYSLSGAAHRTQEVVRQIANTNYNNTPNGLSGNEDCGQMSAWYIFSALGFYPVNPASGEYAIGSPFFDKVSINLPPTAANQKERVLTITAEGASTKQYVKGLTVNGQKVEFPVITHKQIANGGEIVFEMSDSIEKWGNGVLN